MRDQIVFSNNGKVSVRQVNRALFLEIVGISTLILPPALARCCGTDGVFAILVGGGLANLQLVLWEMCYFRRKSDRNFLKKDTKERAALRKISHFIRKSDENLLEKQVQNDTEERAALRKTKHFTGKSGENLSEKQMQTDTEKRSMGAKIGQQMIRMFFAACFLGIAVSVLYLLTSLMETHLLGESYEIVIVLTTVGAAFLGLWKGLESRLRVYEVIFWILLVPLLIILVLACSGICTDYWFPVVVTTWKNFGKGVFFSFLLFSLSMLTFFCRKECNQPERLVSATRRMLIGAVVLNAVIYLILLGVFQKELLGQLPYPVINLMAVVKLPGNFLERQDALMMGIWFFCLFALLHSMLHYATEQVGQIFPGIRKMVLSAVCCLVVTGIVFMLL